MKTQDFPAKAREFLRTFYIAKKAYTNDERISALKDGWNLQHSIFYCAEGQELKTLEFYVLTKLGLI